jgi:predicted Zn-dependent protease
MAPPLESVKRSAPVIIIFLVLISVFAQIGCTVKHGSVPAGVIPGARTMNPQDEQYGSKVFKNLCGNYRLCDKTDGYGYVYTIFEHLKKAADVDRHTWHLTIFEDQETVDVRAVHGNYVFIWTGSIEIAESDDEIAAMLAHEMAHVLARHTEPVRFNVWSNVLFQTVSIAGSIAALYFSQGMVNIMAPDWSKWAYMKAAHLGPMDRDYNKKYEREAVGIALLILARSTYSPLAMLDFWERVENSDALCERTKRLSRGLTPQERVTLIEELLPKLSFRVERSGGQG